MSNTPSDTNLMPLDCIGTGIDENAAWDALVNSFRRSDWYNDFGIDNEA